MRANSVLVKNYFNAYKEFFDFNVYLNPHTDKWEIQYPQTSSIPEKDRVNFADITIGFTNATLQTACEDKLGDIKTKCSNLIYMGFESDALGAMHHYPMGDKDQINLQAAISASVIPSNTEFWTTPIWCQDANNTWAMREHTAAQVHKLAITSKSILDAARGKKASLEQLVNQAKTVDEINAINW